jgi:hypothetical protein
MTEVLPWLRCRALLAARRRVRLRLMRDCLSPCRRTELSVLVPAGQAAVGLHCLHLDVHRVTVDGAAAEVRWHAVTLAS